MVTSASIKPPRLRAGDAVAIISPAGPVRPGELAPGIEYLESAGYRVVLASHLYHRNGYTAGPDPERLEDFHAVISDREIKAVVCARGGYGSLRLLDKIDYGLVQSRPKILVGYSDISALLLSVHARTGLVTFHGPVLKDHPSKGNLRFMLDLLSGGKGPQISLDRADLLMPGRAEGKLIGGNLSLISHLVGTPFIPSFRGKLLFVEDTGEAPYRIDRMFTHLRLSGVLEGLSGLIAGSFEDCGEKEYLHSLLRELASDLDIPAVSGLPVGHGRENITLPIGLPATLDTDSMTLRIDDSCVTA